MSSLKSFLTIVITLSLVAIADTALGDDFGINNPDPLLSDRNTLINAVINTEAIQALSRKWNQPATIPSFRDSVVNAWAWIQVEAESADGRQHSDTMRGVMHRVQGQWKIVEWVSEDVAAAQDSQKAFQDWCSRFEQAHPRCPAEIFPSR